MSIIPKVFAASFLIMSCMLQSCDGSDKKSSKISDSANLIYEDGFNDGIVMDAEDGPLAWTESVNVTESTDPEDSSNVVAQFTFKGSGDDLTGDSWSELRFALAELYTEVWIRYRLYIPENYYHRNLTESSDNNKGYVMLWSGDYSGCNVLVAASWWPKDDGNTYSMGQWKTNSRTSKHYHDEVNSGMAVDRDKDLGKWQDVVVQVKVADFDVKNNGILKIWKNGSLIQSFENIDNYAKDNINNGIKSGYLLGWSNSGFAGDTLLLVDDCKIGKTAASVGFKE